MGSKGKRGNGLSRRDFIKLTAVAGAATAAGFGVAFDPEKAAAYENDTVNYKVTFTTCPYCSASCGQRVVTALTGPSAGRVVDVYGDFESPLNSGGLCAKGAGALQLVNNNRRIGAWAGSHPVNNTFAAKSGAWNTTADPYPSDWPGTDFSGSLSGKSYDDGVAYFRMGNNPWKRVPLAEALSYSTGKLVADRGALDPATYQSKKVAFLGSSHMNNESNYIYRKLIANFGTSNVEHQARI